MGRRILVLGSGGREHALAWKIASSPQCESIFLHPGNDATQLLGLQNLPGNPPLTLQALVSSLVETKIDLVVIGPEVLLAEGLADGLRSAGFEVFGPGKEAAQLETSKAYAKFFLEAAGIPTAAFCVCDDEPRLLQECLSRSLPYVLKLDGLAAGKGVVVAESKADVDEFIQRVYHQGEFGPGPHRVVVENFLPGVELSYIGFCDGESFVPLASSTDYKRLHNGQQGPNTGGMGVVSPSPFFSERLEKTIETSIVKPVLREMQKRKLDFRGALYIGLMIDASGTPRVLEFNTRFGDPETQSILLRMNDDIVTFLSLAARRKLHEAPPIQWESDHSVYVVAAAEGYPESPKKGDVITGWENVKSAQVFFSGVKQTPHGLVTNGGRVLGVGATASSRLEAKAKAYTALKQISFLGMHYRTDIAGD